MKILFTGGSSFTGYWFIKALAAAGHEVVAVFRRTPDEYPDAIRRNRVGELKDICHPVFRMSFGDQRFLTFIAEDKWDLFCHHGADVTDYENPNFDVMTATANNTRQLPAVFDSLAAKGCNEVIVTGSVFESDEGSGTDNLRAFSPYALSKAFTWQLFRYHAGLRSMALGKFVIANPFGPFEEPRFVHYLMKCWFSGANAVVNTPDYIRDNIHVSLLAKIYVYFAENLSGGMSCINPSGYVSSQGAFTQRLAEEMRGRLNRECEFVLMCQKDFPEPRVRVNLDRFDTQFPTWDEASAWDELADFYSRLMGRQDYPPTG